MVRSSGYWTTPPQHKVGRLKYYATTKKDESDQCPYFIHNTPLILFLSTSSYSTPPNVSSKKDCSKFQWQIRLISSFYDQSFGYVLKASAPCVEDDKVR